MAPSYAKAERNQTELVSRKSELASVTVQLDHATQQAVGALRVHCHECLVFQSVQMNAELERLRPVQAEVSCVPGLLCVTGC